MKKLLVLSLVVIGGLLTSNSAQAQARSQLNIGFIGVGYDIPIGTDIGLQPFAATNWDFNYLVAGVKFNYWFDNLVGLPEDFDLYAGINGGYGFATNDTNTSDFDFGAQIGFRWFWSEKMGLYLEGGGGKLGGTAGLGLTIRM